MEAMRTMLELVLLCIKRSPNKILCWVSLLSAPRKLLCIPHRSALPECRVHVLTVFVLTRRNYYPNTYEYHPRHGCSVDFCKNGLNEQAPFVIYQAILGDLQELWQHNDEDVYVARLNLGKTELSTFESSVMFHVWTLDRIFNPEFDRILWRSSNGRYYL